MRQRTGELGEGQGKGTAPDQTWCLAGAQDVHCRCWAPWYEPFPIAQGAETSIYLASSDSVEGITAKYWSDCVTTSSSGESYDRKVCTPDPPPRRGLGKGGGWMQSTGAQA